MSPSDVPQLLQAAVQHHVAGRLDEAEMLYRHVLQIDPNQPDALHLLGVSANQQGRHGEAVELIRRAIERHPQAADYHVNLGNALQALGSLYEAHDSFLRATRLDARSVEAWTNLGNLSLHRGEAAAAELHYRQSLAVRPNHPKALLGMGHALIRQGRPAEGIDWLFQAHSLDPADQPLLVQLADALASRGRFADALGATERLLALAPDHREYLAKHLEMLSQAGRHDAALELARRLVAQHPREAGACNLLGRVLAAQGRLSEALEAFRQARTLGHTDAIASIAHKLWELGRVDEAMAAAREAVVLDKGIAGQPRVLFFANYREQASPQAVIAGYRQWARRLPQGDRNHSPPVAGPGRRLRVGYVSPDFRLHSVSFFMEPVLQHHDRTRFEVYCYFNSRNRDAKTQRLQSLADHWRDVVALDDDELTQCIRQDGIDVLVDLAGHTTGNRLHTFARRAAPVQITYLGYPNTTGVPAMDYRITDAIADPPGAGDTVNTERLLRLPNGFLCYRPEADAPPVAPPPESSAGRVTFGSFNILPKLSPRTLALWARILSRVPGSQLLLKVRALRDPDARNRLTGAFAELGIAADRLVFLPDVADHRGHLEQYGRVDIGLDPLLYNGTTTTCEALWMGVPVVTLRGDRHSARVGASLLHRVGLDDLVAETPEDYVARAVALAGDAERRQRLRRSLRDVLLASPLMDGSGFARELEAAYYSACELPPKAAPLEEELRLRLHGGVSVCVPHDLNALTPNVLLEQEDWFEDEIVFVRSLVEPGDTAIDIGANYGLYTLSIAGAAGPTGRVIAFEPAAATASWLERSVAANAFRTVEILRAGVADRSGPAFLALHDNPELNRVVESEADCTAEAIELVALDDFVSRQDLPPVDFLKIDAEGQEAAILRGGARFFRTQSPLVMFEINDGSRLNPELAHAFESLGYRIYRLVPGLGLLMTWQAEHQDEFALNLFAAKPDRAQRLARRGLLVEEPVGPVARAPRANAWREMVERFAWAGGLRARWLSQAERVETAYLEALDCYAAAHDPALPAPLRLGCLLRAVELLQQLAARSPSAEKLQSLARVLREAGRRQEACAALKQADHYMTRTSTIAEPFLCASPDFEQLTPSGELAAWCRASALHQYQKGYAYSSYFVEPKSTLDATGELHRLGYLLPEMKRRRHLAYLRLGIVPPLEDQALLEGEQENCLNPDYWKVAVTRLI